MTATVTAILKARVEALAEIVGMEQALKAFPAEAIAEAFYIVDEA